MDVDGSYIVDKAAGRRITIHKNGTAFVMRMNILPASNERRKGDAQVLGRLGFTLQED